MGRQKQTELIQGSANHRRTESDYMGALLDAVSLEDWREVVTSAVQMAKGGDPQARNWLSQYLIGRPESKAPTPLNIVVQQLNGTDEVLDKLAHKAYVKTIFTDKEDEYKAQIRAQLAAELQRKIKPAETIENQTGMRVSGDAGAGIEGQ